jgi:hypothetical protein
VKFGPVFAKSLLLSEYSRLSRLDEVVWRGAVELEGLDALPVVVLLPQLDPLPLLPAPLLPAPADDLAKGGGDGGKPEDFNTVNFWGNIFGSGNSFLRNKIVSCRNKNSYLNYVWTVDLSSCSVLTVIQYVLKMVFCFGGYKLVDCNLHFPGCLGCRDRFDHDDVGVVPHSQRPRGRSGRLSSRRGCRRRAMLLAGRHLIRKPKRAKEAQVGCGGGGGGDGLAAAEQI